MSRKQRYIQQLVSILTIFLMAFSLVLPASAMSSNSKHVKGQNNKQLDTSLLEQFEKEEFTRYLVILHEQVDTEKVAKQTTSTASLQSLSASETRKMVQNAVVNEMMANAKTTQMNLKSYLDEEKKEGNIREYRAYFIVNGFAITGKKKVAETLLNHPEVKSVIIDEKKQLLPINDVELEEQLDRQLANNEIEWHVDRINAPEVWEKGITGEGVIVASIDSGVEVNHPALKAKYRGYNPDNPDELDHEFNWYDAVSGRLSPMDSDGHGTHTMGTILGQEEDGSNKIGVAPGAKWISTRAFWLNEGYDSDILASGEWVLAPTDDNGVPHPEKAPDVVNNSWGGNPYNNDWFRPMVKAWRAVGIVPIFSVGNAGFSAASPGSASAPGNYPESIAVGATTETDDLASFSLRGPTERGDVKPDIVAPGVNIRSSYPGETWDTFAYGTSNGTSMAAPQVTATVALLKQVDSTLTIEEIENILKLSAKAKTDENYSDYPNNGYGYGLLDALAAVESVEQGIGTIEGQVLYEGEDSEAPSYEHDARKVAFENRDSYFSIRASDNISIEKVVLKIELNNEIIREYVSERVEGDHLDGIYEVIIPSSEINGASFNYWWEIQDFSGEETISEIYEVDVKEGVTTGYVQDFESYPDGWYSYGRFNSWEWGIPQFGPEKAASGSKVMGTNLRGEYEMDADMTLIMPPVIVEEDTQLRFKQWYSLSWFGHDKGKVFVSTDDENWDEVYRITSDNESWHEVGIDLSDYAGEKVSIAFNLTSMDNKFPGWYIDDVKLVQDQTNTSNITGAKNITLTKESLSYPSSENVSGDLLPAEATVKVKETGWETKANPQNGRFYIYHPPGEYTLEIERYGFKSITEKVTITERGVTTAQFTLEEMPKQQVVGSIVDLIGNGIQNATLLFTKDGQTTTIKSNVDGTFNANLLEGNYTLIVYADGFYNDKSEISIVAGEANNINIELSRFFSKGDEEIKYDNGSYDKNLAFGSAGSGFAVKMSLADGEKSALVTGAKLQFWAGHVPVPGGDDILISIYDAKGKDGNPGNKLAGPVEAKAKRDLYNWTEVDLSDLGIVVDDDFYIVYLQADDFPYVPGFVADGDRNNAAGRSYDYIGGQWFKADESYGNYMIRALVDYGLDDLGEVEPTITSPINNFITNETSISVQGTATPQSTIKLVNNGNEVGDVEVNQTGYFSMEVDLVEGSNEIIAVSLVDGEPYLSSEKVTVISDTIAPELSIDSPEDGHITRQDAITAQGTVSDENFDFVTVNGVEVVVNDNKFSQAISLSEGENTIEVIAQDKAGNSTTKSITVILTTDDYSIKNLHPANDQHVFSGDTVKVSFESDLEGGEASYIVKLPIQNVTQSANRQLMEEVEPGKYEGTWVVPANTNLNGAIFEVQLTDESGNTVSAEAPGKLYIYQENIERISGKTRYDTAIQTSQTGWSQADTVVLARGDNYADSLAGVPLAYQLDAPILLTRPSTLYEGTMAEIKRLGATKIVVLGGTEAVSDEIVTELENEGLEVERISGKTRFATAALIAERVAPVGATKAVVASGVDFPDALSIASHAAKKGLPILLTRANSLPEETDQAIENLGVEETLVIGGTVAIASEVMDLLPDAERLRGSTRYETNIEIAKHFDVRNKHMFVATGTDYADALTGAVLAAKNDSTILLVKNELPEVVSEFITEREVTRLSVFGGTIAVEDQVLQELGKLLK